MIASSWKRNFQSRPIRPWLLCLILPGLLLGCFAGQVMARQGLVASYNQAKRADTRFHIAQTNTRIANASYRGARGRLLPQLSASGRYQYVKQHETLAPRRV